MSAAPPDAPAARPFGRAARRIAPWAALLVTGLACARPVDLGPGHFTAAEARALLDKTRTIRLDPDLSGLSPPERAALDRLIEAGPIFQRLLERQLHPQALEAHARLVELDRRHGSPARTRDLLDLYRLFQGPIATTLDNRRVPFLPVEPERPGKSLYPTDADSAALAAFMDRHPDALDPRAVVRRASDEAIAGYLATLDRHPALDSLHGGFRGYLDALRGAGERDAFVVVPYAIEYADDVLAARTALIEAADHVAPADAAFASYLRLRARDLLTGDYRASDSAWVTGRYANLNAQIGSYESYADQLHGVKTQFGLSLLVRDREASEAIAAVTAGIQTLEDSLPYATRRRVRTDMPVGVYNVVADFGDPRGTNTATILPNEPHITRRFGRTILLRANIMRDSSIFDDVRRRFEAAVAPEHAADLTRDGGFHRTLWHEIGHYLGPEFAADGREIDVALGDAASVLEEMKADLISLHSGRALRRAGYYDETSLRGLYASGVLRVLRRVRPRRDEPYGTMQLMQFNWYLDRGVLELDRVTGRLAIRHARFHDAVRALLAETLALQLRGDKPAADAFIERWTAWRPDVHEVLAERMRAAEGSRFQLVRYAALGE